GHVDDAGPLPTRCLEEREPEVDRDAALLLLLQPVGLLPREGADERRLAVVDVPRRADDEGHVSRGRRRARPGRKCRAGRGGTDPRGCGRAREAGRRGTAPRSPRRPPWRGPRRVPGWATTRPAPHHFRPRIPRPPATRGSRRPAAPRAAGRSRGRSLPSPRAGG